MNHFAVHQKLTQHCKSTIFQLKKICLITDELCIIKCNGYIPINDSHLIRPFSNI